MNNNSFTVASNFNIGDYVWCNTSVKACTGAESLLYDSLIALGIKGVELFRPHTLIGDIETFRLDSRIGHQVYEDTYIIKGQVVATERIPNTPFFRHLVKLITGETRYFAELFELNPCTPKTN